MTYLKLLARETYVDGGRVPQLKFSDSVMLIFLYFNNTTCVKFVIHGSILTNQICLGILTNQRKFASKHSGAVFLKFIHS